MGINAPPTIGPESSPICSADLPKPIAPAGASGADSAIIAGTIPQQGEVITPITNVPKAIRDMLWKSEKIKITTPGPKNPIKIIGFLRFI